MSVCVYFCTDLSVGFLLTLFVRFHKQIQFVAFVLRVQLYECLPGNTS